MGCGWAVHELRAECGRRAHVAAQLGEQLGCSCPWEGRKGRRGGVTRTRTRLLRGGERAAREKRCREPCSLPVGRTAAALTPAAASRRRRRARGAAARGSARCRLRSWRWWRGRRAEMALVARARAPRAGSGRWGRRLRAAARQNTPWSMAHAAAGAYRDTQGTACRAWSAASRQRRGRGRPWPRG